LQRKDAKKIHSLHGDQHITVNIELFLAIKLFHWFKFNTGLNTNHMAYLKLGKQKRKAFTVLGETWPESQITACFLTRKSPTVHQAILRA
jgi:hypothetical protein